MAATTHEPFHLNLEQFAGPLDVLLALIEKKKLLINDISLAQVTDDFIQYLKEQSELPIDSTSHFVFIASTLLLIKSRSLLPSLSLSSEEEETIVNLESRLRLYQYIKERARTISSVYGKAPLYLKEARREEQVVFAPPRTLSSDILLETMHSILDRLPQVARRDQVDVPRIMSLEDMIENLKERINRTLRITFSELHTKSSNASEKVNIIVSFLAVLELVKQEMIVTTQSNHFGDIELETRSLDVPHY